MANLSLVWKFSTAESLLWGVVPSLRDVSGHKPGSFLLSSEARWLSGETSRREGQGSGQ